MRILLITETFLPQVNGIVRTLEKLLRFLEQNNHHSLVITLGEGDNKYSATEIIRVPGVKFSLYEDLYIVKPIEGWLEKLLETNIMQIPVSLLQTLIPNPHPIVEEAIEKFKPDVIHLVTPTTLGAVGYYYVEKFKIPCLATFHTDLAAYTSRYQVPLENIVNVITKLVYNRIDRVLAPSPSSLQQLNKIGVKNVGIFGRGVDTALFNPGKRNREILKTYKLNPNKITLMYAGRLADEKSIPILINSFKSLITKHDIQLLLVGDGPIRSVLEHDLKNDTKSGYALTGLQKGDELAALYASSDIFAFPSKTETFGQVVLEAMASGLPVVGFDSPGVRDLVQDNVTGFLVKDSSTTNGSNDSKFTEAIEKLILAPELRDSFGLAGQKEAYKRGWEQVLNGLIKEYEVLLSKKPSTISL